VAEVDIQSFPYGIRQALWPFRFVSEAPNLIGPNDRDG
jgi:hypothetical protein